MNLDPCILWPNGTKKCNGYGVLYRKLDGKWKQLLAHRWTWEHLNGPIPAGMCVLHKDMTRKGRRRRGDKRGEKNNFHFYTA